MKITRYLVPSLLASSLLAGGATGVFAAHKKAAAPHAFAYGQVSNLSATGFTLTRNPKKASTGATSRVVQVVLSSTTKEKARKGTAGTLANGEYALVAGAKAPSGISAERVLYSAKVFKARRLILRLRAERILRMLSRQRVAGTVAAGTSSTNLAITTRQGKTLTFAITAKTAFRVNRQHTSTAPALTSGEKVRVFFRSDRATKTRTALLVIVTA